MGLTKAELKARAAKYFNRFKQADKVYLTSDGQVFPSENKDEAVNHKVDKKLQLHSFTRNEAKAAPKELPKEEPPKEEPKKPDSKATKK